MTIVDADIIQPSNINRQIVATQSHLGEAKAFVLAERLRDINPELELEVIQEFLRDDSMVELLARHPYDFVVDAIDSLCVDVPDAARTLARAFWPGGLTLILRARPDLGWDLGETGGTIGVRMPNQDALLRLLRDFGPMAVTSANLTGQPPATSVEAAIGYFGGRVAAYLDGGPTPGSTASSIVDFAHGAPRALRLGTICLDDLSAAAGVAIAPVQGSAS